MRRQGVAVLGATGSIGRQALDVIDRHPDRFEAFGLATGSVLPDRPARFTVVATDPDADARLQEMVTHPECDIVLVAIAGAAALKPTLAALRAHKTIALATKEVLVMAGHLVTAMAGPDAIRPVDSEPSAIWQCLRGESMANVARLLVTASGGPFWARPEIDPEAVTVAEALRHPRWSMGPKVTVDSATMMNKGLEVIEAHHLFGVPLERIEVVVHPQSAVHSLVEFVDGSIKAQLGVADMRLPIAVALAHPDRLPGAVPAAIMCEMGPLDFQPLDGARFPAVQLARAAAAAGGTMPAVLNAANEEAAAAFLRGACTFGAITRLVESALSAHPGGADTGLEAVLGADRWAREHVLARLGAARER
ncbi:MAG: 1-deoxy-D-xylulose-5-phosphate reductoisomerase [Candidatus Dormibacteraceae bacterium]